MSVKHQATVENYVRQHAAILAALANLTEFADSMPAPDESGYLRNVDYGYTGSVGRLMELLAEATEIVDSMSR